MKEENNSTIEFCDFETTLSVTDRATEQKISNGNIDPNNPLNHLDLIDIYTTTHTTIPKQQKNFFSADRSCLDLSR